MQTLSEIRALLDERGLRPRHRLGQNFLHDKNQLRRLVDAADLAPGEVVLEVGPGTGTLTEALLDAEAQVVACEIDKGLAALVADRLGDRVQLVVGDCLRRGRALNPDVVNALAGRAFKLVANLPYQIAGTLLGTLLVHHPRCTGLYVTIQKEVADRLGAGPGGKDYGALTIVVQALAEVRRIGDLGPTCFWPQPKVTSSMFAMRPRADHGIDDRPALADFVARLFTHRRKQLGTILGRDTTIWPEGVAPTMRPESLRVDQVLSLWRGVRA
jgi:16S rRNA (adenine1518-N6/adenine1519-N6)-dimethyltransferase